LSNSITLQAEEGMTWGEWINSSYNITNFSILGNYIQAGAFPLGKSDVGVVRPVSSDDIIVINGIYEQITASND